MCMTSGSMCDPGDCDALIERRGVGLRPDPGRVATATLELWLRNGVDKLRVTAPVSTLR